VKQIQHNNYYFSSTKRRKVPAKTRRATAIIRQKEDLKSKEKSIISLFHRKRTPKVKSSIISFTFSKSE
jgi:hypothetical protein